MDRVSLLAMCTVAFLSCAGSTQYAAEPVPSAAHQIDRWQPLIAEAATRFGLPEGWIRTVMLAESGGQTMRNGRPITSPAGAMGLMQLMPDTYDEMRARHGLGDDPYDPRDNILAGAAYLRAMYQRFGYPGLFAAYNAGPARYNAHQNNGRPLPPETRAFLVALDLPGLAASAAHDSASKRRLFFPLRTTGNTSSKHSDAALAGGLFVPLHTSPADR